MALHVTGAGRTGVGPWRRAILLGCTLVSAAWAATAQAANLVQNGGFSQTSTPGSYQFGSGFGSRYDPVDTLTDWTTSGYNFVFAPGAGTSGSTADTTGALGSDGSLLLWGPGDGSGNGLILSPDGGNFIAADGDYEVSAISQTIVGLIPGQPATLQFYWAGAQQEGFTAATTDQWQVSLGGQTQYTPVVAVSSEGFSGWITATMTFTPTSSAETLSFLAIGTGAPPFALLDGVSLTQNVTEPASWAMLATGLAGLIVFKRWRRKATRTIPPA